MNTKLYRVVSYVLDLNGGCPDIESIIRQIENNKYPEFHKVKEIEVVDIGEWNDDHPANKADCDFLQYFPHLDSHVNKTQLKKDL